MSKKQRYRKHGLVALKRAMQGHIDPRSKLGLLLADLRMDLVADLGGPKLVTQAQQLVVERVIRAKLRADAGEAWLDEQPIEARLDERVLAIERETRMQGEAMVRWLSLLGLERRKAPMKSLADAWAEKLSAEAQDHDDVEQAPGSEPEAPDKPLTHSPEAQHLAMGLHGDHDGDDEE